MTNSIKSVQLMFCGFAMLIVSSVTGWGQILTDTFSARTNNQVLTGYNVWTNSSSLVVTLSNVTDGVYASVPIQEAATNFTAGGANATNVWIDMIAKPLLWDGTNTDRSTGFDTNAAVGFYFWTNKNPVVLDGGTWTEVTSAVGAGSHQINTTKFDRLTAKLNYSTKTWSLFVGGVLVRTNIAFQTSVDPGSYQWLSVKDDCDFDGVYVSTTWPDAARVNGPNTIAALTNSYDGDIIPDAWEIDKFDSTVYNETSDTDGDGFNNYTEYKTGTDPTNPDSYSARLPYIENFEVVGPIQGAGPYTKYHGLTPSGSVKLVAATDMQGSYYLGISSGAVDYVVNDPDATNIWFSIYVKPVAFEANPELADGTNQSAAFCVLTNGSLLAYDATGWSNPDLVPKVPTNRWLQFQAHLDYASSNWNLYVSTSGVFEGACDLVNSDVMKFNVNYKGATAGGFTIQNTHGDWAYVDQIAMQYSRDDVVAGGGDVSNAVVLNAELGWNEVAVPEYPASGNTLGGALGTDLLTSLEIGDQVRVFNSNGWHTFTKTSSTTWDYDNDTPNEVQIPPLLGIWIYRPAGEPSLPIVFSTILTDSIEERLHDATQQAGWNSRAAPSAFGTTLSSANDFGVQNGKAVTSDQVWEYKEGRYYKLWKDADGSWRLDGLKVSTPYVVTRQHWYKVFSTGGTIINTFNR